MLYFVEPLSWFVYRQRSLLAGEAAFTADKQLNLPDLSVFLLTKVPSVGSEFRGLEKNAGASEKRFSSSPRLVS